MRLDCAYWGPAGSVSHLAGVWAYTDGQREPLNADERALALRRVIDHARARDGIALRITGA